jgi:hypothetical protein
MQSVWPWVDALVYSFLPFVVILALNVLIVRQVLIARQERDSLRGGTHKSYRQRRPSQEGSTRLTVMLLTISFSFLVTTLPMNVVAIAAAFLDKGVDMEGDDDMRTSARFQLARTVAELLMYSNHAVNFYLYCATGQKFRRQLVWMVCYARRSYISTTAVCDRHSAPAVMGAIGANAPPCEAALVRGTGVPSRQCSQREQRLLATGGSRVGGVDARAQRGVCGTDVTLCMIVAPPGGAGLELCGGEVGEPPNVGEKCQTSAM